MKPILRKTLFVGLALASALAITNCKLAMYPIARAFGGPSDAKLAECRVSFQQMKTHLNASLVQVAPVLLAKGPGREWREDLARMLIEEMLTQTGATLALASAAPDVPRATLGHNQMRTSWERAETYARWVGVTHPKCDYILFTEIFASGGKVAAIHLFIVDSQGRIAYRRALNSHQFGGNLSSEQREPIRLLVKTLFSDLARDADTMFPPYGVG